MTQYDRVVQLKVEWNPKVQAGNVVDATIKLASAEGYPVSQFVGTLQVVNAQVLDFVPTRNSGGYKLWHPGDRGWGAQLSDGMVRLWTYAFGSNHWVADAGGVTIGVLRFRPLLPLPFALNWLDDTEAWHGITPNTRVLAPVSEDADIMGHAGEEVRALEDQLVGYLDEQMGEPIDAVHIGEVVTIARGATGG